MAWQDIAAMVDSLSLTGRIKGCAATQAVRDVDTWWYQHRWPLAASPGWHEAWGYARTAGTPDPGSDEAVITDGDILAAVQSLIDNGTVP